MILFRLYIMQNEIFYPVAFLVLFETFTRGVKQNIDKNFFLTSLKFTHFTIHL